MKSSKANLSAIATKCKNILVSNWHGNLNTIKADSKGRITNSSMCVRTTFLSTKSVNLWLESHDRFYTRNGSYWRTIVFDIIKLLGISKQDVYTSKVKYLANGGDPYIWVPEKDLHNVNVLVDERASFAVASPHPGPLAKIFRSTKKLPARIALTGEVYELKDKTVKSVNESLREMIIAEQTEIAESNYGVSGILSSSTYGCTARSENLVELLDEDASYVIYKFSTSSCTFIDGNGGNHEVSPDEFESAKSDELAPLATKLIDGINQSEIRRRALVVLCFSFLNVHAKDAYVKSVDCQGFDVFAKVLGSDGQYKWKEYRLTLSEEVQDVRSFCCRLVEMEEAALDQIKSLSGLG